MSLLNLIDKFIKTGTDESNEATSRSLKEGAIAKDSIGISQDGKGEDE